MVEEPEVGPEEPLGRPPDLFKAKLWILVIGGVAFAGLICMVVVVVLVAIHQL